MARLYAQLMSVVFVVVVVLGLVAGDASHHNPDGGGGGNLGSITLHHTWAREALDVALLAAFAVVGFVAGRRTGRLIAIAAGAVLLALGIAGFARGDDFMAGPGFLGMHFPLTVNVFDLVTGVLGVLAGLGTLEDDEAATA